MGFPRDSVVWLDRLDQDGVDPVRLALAIDGLSVVKESQAVNSLRRLARDQIKPSEIRLKSALALGRIQREDLESTASDLMSPLSVASGTAGSSATPSLLNRLVSARLLRYHSGDKAVEQLMQLAVDPQGAVASIALERLLEIDPSLVQPINEQIVHSPDASVRWLAGQALTGQATVEAVVLLGGLLDDPIPDIRIQTADQMVVLDADSRLTSTVRSSVDGNADVGPAARCRTSCHGSRCYRPRAGRGSNGSAALFRSTGGRRCVGMGTAEFGRHGDKRADFGESPQ